MSEHANKRFYIPSDFPLVSDRLVKHYMSTIQHAAMQQRVKCALANNIPVWDTDIEINTDPDNPNVIIITAYPRAVVVEQ